MVKESELISDSINLKGNNQDGFAIDVAPVVCYNQNFKNPEPTALDLTVGGSKMAKLAPEMEEEILLKEVKLEEAPENPYETEENLDEIEILEEKEQIPMANEDIYMPYCDRYGDFRKFREPNC